MVLGDTTKYGDQFHVDTQFTTKDRALSVDMFSDRVLKPCIATIGNKIDRDGLLMAKNSTANIVGVAGTPPTGLLTYLTAGAYLDAEAAPRPQRNISIEPFTSAAIVDGLKGLFTPQSKIDPQFKKGLMGTDSAGMNWKMDQNVVNQQFGSWATTAGAVTVNGGSQGLATGWASSSTISLNNSANTLNLNKGDIIYFANVFGVNPQNRQAYGSNRLRSFVVNADTNQVGAGNFNISVSPALIYAGQFQNVTASPAGGAAVTFFSLATGTANEVVSPQNILCQRGAFTLATADLPMPEGVDFAGRASDKSSGLSIRVVRQYTINNDSLPTRIDVLYGWAPLYQELACRIVA